MYFTDRVCTQKSLENSQWQLRAEGEYLKPLLSRSPEFNSSNFCLSVGLRIERECC